jgi:hypothetical protein
MICSRRLPALEAAAGPRQGVRHARSPGGELGYSRPRYPPRVQRALRRGTRGTSECTVAMHAAVCATQRWPLCNGPADLAAAHDGLRLSQHTLACTIVRGASATAAPQFSEERAMYVHVVSAAVCSYFVANSPAACLPLHLPLSVFVMAQRRRRWRRRQWRRRWHLAPGVACSSILQTALARVQWPCRLRSCWCQRWIVLAAAHARMQNRARGERHRGAIIFRRARAVRACCECCRLFLLSGCL